MRKTLLATLLSLLVGGCMVGPDYVRPPVDAPTAWRLSEPEVKDLANTAWWEQFGDPVLNDLVAEALRGNKDLMIAAARIDEFAGNYGFVRSGLFPQVGAGYEAKRQRDISAVVVGAGEGYTYNSYSAVLNASWEIDIWGRIRRQTEAANAQLLASEEGRRGVILSLVGSVAGAYINLRNLDRQLEIARATAKSRGESYELFKLRFEGGVISLLELSQNNKRLQDAIHIVLAEFSDLTSQRLKGTLDNSEATRRLNVIHDKILVALGAFDSAGRVLPGSVVIKKNSATSILGKLALLFGVLFIIMMMIQINPFSNNRLIDLGALRFIPLWLGLITFVGYVLAVIVGSLKK